MVRVEVYASVHKETMWRHGEEAGLSEKALWNFRHALSELPVTLEVDERTGDATIVEIDGHPWPPGQQ